MSKVVSRVYKGKNFYKTFNAVKISQSGIREEFFPAAAMAFAGKEILAIEDLKSLQKKYPDAVVVDWSSFYLFPGLINTHVHLEFDSTANARPRYLQESTGTRFLLSAANAHTLLESGVTTARDAGSSWELLNLRLPQVQTVTAIPNLQFAGPPLTITGGHLHFLGCETDTLEDMVKQVRLRKKQNCDAVKLIVTGGQMTPGSMPEQTYLHTREIQTACAEAHNLHLPVFAHCLTTEGTVRCLKGGVDCIEHMACFIRNQKNGLLERKFELEKMRPFREDGRYFMMGLSAGYHNLDSFRNGDCACGEKEQFLLEQEKNMFDIFRSCIELGFRPVCGTDAGTAGTLFSETWLELALMAERGGLTTREAIRIGTVQSAKCIGVRAGRLEPGYQADLIALRENPLQNIRALGQAEHVVCNGKIEK